MKTAEVAIEHVLAGILGLCAFVLPFLTAQTLSFNSFQSGAIVGVLGLAYLFGVVLDKVSDTVLNPIEHCLRLQNADIRLNEGKPSYRSDAFPQNILEYELRKENDGRLEWMDSLRSRIRTVRNLTVLGPPAAMGLVIYLVSDDSGIKSSFYLGVAVILTAASISVLLGRLLRMPRTYELRPDRSLRENQLKQAKKIAALRLFAASPIIVVPMVTMVIIIANRTYPIGGATVVICGLLAWILALWSWTRITKTYMSFIQGTMQGLVG